jgi:hypothetical protein
VTHDDGNIVILFYLVLAVVETLWEYGQHVGWW